MLNSLEWHNSNIEESGLFILKHNQELEAAFLGEHNYFVLKDILGYGVKEITQLEKNKVIFSDNNT